ncbi:winged helix DNA-binding protein [Isoptericola jiangsuensis]|uniref:Winged helix DNA-binding protein n=1 Tax=Isoptericola jiangsuensis TaxID=548579 RepID=A0A2A9EXH3_9MICO|nr:winged helix DNA-binding domain-containing protein [Isoptericola jiangsuensis]PFG43847.1 winged helix DNA-binding protein [Isoptericola jiangsuensis]
MPVRVSRAELGRTTLARQHLLRRPPAAERSAVEVVGDVGGLQAQHADMPYLGLAARRDGPVVDAVQDALTARSLVKATVMRSTLHLLPAGHWPSADVTSAEGRLASWRPSARRAGLDLTELNAAVREHCARPRTVDEVEAFAAALHPGVDAAAAIPGGVSRAWWRLASAGGGLVHVPPSGFWREHGEHRVVDGAAWFGAADRPSPDEARAGAVARYLRAFGPATRADVARGVGIRGKRPLAVALDRLELRTLAGPDGADLLDLAGLDVVPGDTAAPVRLLPRWDQLLVAFDDRTRLLDADVAAHVFRRNGDVLPTVWVDGRVVGTWSPAAPGDPVVQVTALRPLTGDARDAVEAEARRVLAATGQDAAAEVTWSDDGPGSVRAPR